MRGIDLNSFDHFIRQLNEPDGERVGVPTLFFPMTRVERITLDEPTGSIPSMDELFARKLGRRPDRTTSRSSPELRYPESQCAAASGRFPIKSRYCVSASFRFS